MSAVLIVVPVFALIAAGYAAVALRFISPTAHKGISEFAFSIAIPALLFRIVVVAEFPAVNAFAVWGAYYGATAATWIVALLASSALRQSRADGAVLAIGSIYGNIVMLGLPLTLSALGSPAAGSMALILSVNTPLLWLCGTLQMAWAERKSSESAPLLVLRAVREIARNPIMLALGFGFLWRLTGLGLHPVADRTLELLRRRVRPRR
jgi:malonate transporter